MAKRQYTQINPHAHDAYIPVVVRICAVQPHQICLVVPGWGSNRVVACPIEQVNEDFRPHLKLWSYCVVEATTTVADNEPVKFRNFRMA
jgi:hypothetical protein